MMDLNAKIVVTGGTGFVGSYILRKLLAEGYTQIYATIRSSSTYEMVDDIKAKVNWVEVALNDVFGLSDLFQNTALLIHTAALVSYDPKDREKLLATNQGCSKIIVDAALDKQVDKTIFVSSIAALGRDENVEFIDEKTAWVDGKHNSDYGVSKHLAELEFWRGKAEGLDISIINPGLIIGAGVWYKSSPAIFSVANKGNKYYTTGSTGVVDVRDVSDMIYALIQNDSSGERFICTAENWNYKRLFSLMATELGVAPPTKPIGNFLAYALVLVMKLAAIFSKKGPAITAEQLKALQFPAKYDNGKSKSILNFEYRDIESSIVETAKAFKTSKELKNKFAILNY